MVPWHAMWSIHNMCSMVVDKQILNSSSAVEKLHVFNYHLYQRQLPSTLSAPVVYGTAIVGAPNAPYKTS